MLVFAFDEIRGTGESFPGFSGRKRELSEAFLDIGQAAGDKEHISGPVDYVVRITTSKWTFQALPAPDAFIVVDNVDNLLVFEKRDGKQQQSILQMNSDEEWFDGLCDAFREFRERLDEG
jgi:hypothetical protein